MLSCLCGICAMACSLFCNELESFISASDGKTTDLSSFKTLCWRMRMLQRFSLGFGATSPFFIAAAANVWLRHHIMFYLLIMSGWGEVFPQLLAMILVAPKRASGGGRGNTQSYQPSRSSSTKVAVTAFETEQDGVEAGGTAVAVTGTGTGTGTADVQTA